MSSSFSKKLAKTGKIISVTAWVAFGFIAAQVTMLYLLRLLINSDLTYIDYLQTPLWQLAHSAIAYSIALAIVLTPFLLTFRQHPKIKETLGLIKKPTLKMLGWVVLGYGVYTVLSIVFLAVATTFPGFDTAQQQHVGFRGITSSLELVMAFCALVIIAPIAEELLFRGYLFGNLRQNTSFWTSTLITSGLFGLIHLQWNVGVDVFALSLVLCLLREKTGSLWAPIGLHMAKNTIAFTLLFLYPDLLKNLL